MFYAWAAQMLNQFDGNRNVTFVNGEPILDYYGLSGRGSAWAFLGYEFVFLVGLVALVYVTLRFKRYSNR
jgi:hypothetical protein